MEMKKQNGAGKNANASQNAQGGKKGFGQMLLDTVEIDRKLVHAVGKGDLEGVKAALAEGGNPNTSEKTTFCDWRGEHEYLITPLGMAIKHGNTEIVKALLEGGADMNVEVVRIWKKETLEFMLKGSPLAVVLERAAGLKLDDATADEIAKALLEWGADPNCDVEYVAIGGMMVRMPAIHFAVRFCSIEMLKMLLEHGADANKFYDDETAIEDAKCFDSEEAVRLLREHGARE